MDVQTLTSLALSAKFNTTPHTIQAFIRRVLCGHRHDLILNKLAGHGLTVSNPPEINLSLSVGDIALDLACNRLQDAPEYRFRRFGTTRVEQDELRPLDYYDVVSILYFASQNLTDHIISHYVRQEGNPHAAHFKVTHVNMRVIFLGATRYRCFSLTLLSFEQIFWWEAELSTILAN